MRRRGTSRDEAVLRRRLEESEERTRQLLALLVDRTELSHREIADELDRSASWIQRELDRAGGQERESWGDLEELPEPEVFLEALDDARLYRATYTFGDFSLSAEADGAPGALTELGERLRAERTRM